MYVGMARYDFRIPGSKSLKEKRKVVRHIVDGFKAKFNASVAEIDHLDLRQRGVIGVSCVSNSSAHVHKMLNQIERAMRSEYMIEMIGVETEVVTPDD